MKRRNGVANKYKPKKKNGVIRISIAIKPQTYYHLCKWCAMAGLAVKDIGRIIDKLVSIACANFEGVLKK